MRKRVLSTVMVMLGLSLFFLVDNQTQAASTTSTGKVIKILSNEGDTTIYGSVLNPREDDVNILLSKSLLAKIRKAGISKLKVNLTSSLDSTKTYTVPNDAISMQRKKIGKKSGKYLVISLFNLTSQSGITVSPSALPSDNYKLRIAGKELDLVTDAFAYQTPALIVGTVTSTTAGLVSIEDLLGEKISERTVATNPNGTFFTEVRASRMTQADKARKYWKHLMAQVTEGSAFPGVESIPLEGGGEEIEVGSCVVHATTDTDLYAIAPLVNDPETNAAISDEPIKVDESSTLTANLALESAKEGNEDLANEIALGELEDLAEFEEGEGDFEDEDFFGEPGCDIEKFASGCSEDESALSLIGKDFRDFVVTATCRFPGFNLIKKIIPKLPEEANVFIGKGYCEHVGRETDEDRPCKIYSEILRDFKAGRMVGKLICPPYHCEEFKDIRPPKCVNPQVFCDEMELVSPGPHPMPMGEPRFATSKPSFAPPPRCVERPMKDLFCARIGVDIKAEECSDRDFFGPRNFSPGWKVVKNSKGNEYCVPSNIPEPPPLPVGVVDWRPPPSTPEEIAEECELNACHRTCEEKNGFKPPYPSPEPFAPPAVAGFIETDPLPGVVRPLGGVLPQPEGLPGVASPASSTDVSSSSSSFASSVVRGQSFSPVLPPYDPPKCEVCDCHFACDAEAGRVADCGNPRSKYFAKKCCEHNLGPGVGPPPTIFLQTTYAGQHEPPMGSHGGNFFGPRSPKNEIGPIPHDLYGCLCENLGNFNEKGFIKEETQRACENKCPPHYEKDPEGAVCLPICSEFGQGLVRDHGGNCRKKCPEGYIITGNDECVCPPPLVPGPDGKCIQDNGPSCPPGQNYDPTTRQCIGAPPTTCQGNMHPNPNYRDGREASCLCPNNLPYWDTNAQQCVAVCPSGTTPSPTTNMPPGSPIPCSGSTQCPPGQIYVEENVVCVTAPCPPIKRCLCPDRSLPDANGQCLSQCSSDRPYKCSDGSCVAAAVNCPVQCPGATPHRCPDGRCVFNSTECTAQNYCEAGVTVGTGGCTCAPPGYSSGLSTTCQCSPGYSIAYSKQGCGATLRNCAVGEIPAPLVCQCAPGAAPAGPGIACQCPTGQTYTGTACSTMTSPTLNFSSATISNNNLVITFLSSNLGAGCPYLYNSTGTNIYSLCGAEGTRTENISLSVLMPAVMSGDVLKLCVSNAPAVCSNTVTVTTVASQCTGGKVLDANTNTCVCPTGQTQDTNDPNLCNCPNGKQKDTSNPALCVDCPACLGGKVFGTQACGCVCPQGQYEDSNGICQCPAGQVKQGTACVPHTVRLDNATITNDNLIVTYHKNFSECVLLIDANDNSYILHNGVNAYGLLCDAANQAGATTTSTNSLGNFLVYPGKQLKLCKNNSNTLGYASLDLNACSSPIAVADTNTINLSSAVLSGGNLTITYTKNFDACVGLRDPNNSNYKITSQNQYCTNSGTVTTPTSSLVGGYNTTLAAGNQVKLCLTATGMPQTCSMPITVTSQ